MTNRVDVAVGVIIKDGSVLIAQRPKHLHQGDKWEFPGGKVEAGESTESALVRELSEELGIDVTEHQSWFSLQYDYPDKQVNLHMSTVKGFTGVPIGKEGQPLIWAPFNTLNLYTFPDANVPIIEKLMAGEFN